jgi:hypothetical protein
MFKSRTEWMTCLVVLSTTLLSGVVQTASASNGNFSTTCKLTEKRQVEGGMLVSTKTKPQRVKVDFLDGGFTFKFNGIMYTSPRLNAQGVAGTPDGQQYIYSKADRAFSVSNGEQYLELTKCK